MQSLTGPHSPWIRYTPPMNRRQLFKFLGMGALASALPAAPKTHDETIAERVKRLKAHWRQTYRINPALMEKVRTLKSTKVHMVMDYDAETAGLKQPGQWRWEKEYRCTPSGKWIPVEEWLAGQ